MSEKVEARSRRRAKEILRLCCEGEGLIHLPPAIPHPPLLRLVSPPPHILPLISLWFRHASGNPVLFCIASSVSLSLLCTNPFITHPQLRDLVFVSLVILSFVVSAFCSPPSCACLGSVFFFLF
ncbi:hypothetical protein DFJ73DRAFT_854876 [Zopfochytrium polystomum]|nr:hypothetical protein DFJ73DRAFT_854876 [Zopfochytrium polystomum]